MTFEIPNLIGDSYSPNLNVQEQFCIHSCMDLECTSRTCEKATIC